MTQAIIAYGATVEKSTDGGTTFVRIPKCKGVAVPTDETNYLDVTSLDSENRRREFIPGLLDAGVIELETSYTPDGYEQQEADRALGVPILYRTTLAPFPGQASGDVFRFGGFPTPSISADDVEGEVMMTISIRTTGDVTWTKGAAA